MADVELFAGEPEASARSYRRAHELAAAAGERVMTGYERADEAMALCYAEDPEAMAKADEALARLRQRPDVNSLAFGLYVAGEARLESDPDAAAALLEEALEAARAGNSRLVIGAAGVSLLSITARREPRAALGSMPDLIDHWLRAGLWTQLWTTMRLLIEALAATGEQACAARLLGAHEASRRAAPPYGADERRRAELRTRLEDDLGVDAVARLLDEGRAMSDDEAVTEGLSAAVRAAEAG
jgi:hypothetical protein